MSSVVVVGGLFAGVVLGEEDFEQNPLQHKIRASVSVDFSREIGPLRTDIVGINEGPTLHGADARRQQMADLREMGIKSVRLHDIPLTNPGQKLVDVQDIFPVWSESADPRDERNYFFEQTDDYLKTIIECGVDEIVYRLGTSIEWTSPRQYFAKCPKDMSRYAEICAGIVRHYTKTAWANGFDAHVTHWEIWNEPNLKGAMWDKDTEAYLSFYATVAKRLKTEFPDIRVGGPAYTGLDRPFLEHMVEFCKKIDAPVDFISWHGYLVTPDGGKWCLKYIRDWRKWLDDRGMKNCQLIYDEWHYFPCTWTDLASPQGRRRWQRDAADGMHGIDSAAFITLCYTRWQDVPVDRTHFYMFTGPDWGLYDPEGEAYTTLDAFKLWRRFSDGINTRVAVEDFDNYGVLAGIAENGMHRILVSDFRPGESNMESDRKISLKGVNRDGAATVQVLDAGSRRPRTVTVTFSDGVIRLPSKVVSGSAIYLVEFM